jgi:hypothetical protein
VGSVPLRSSRFTPWVSGLSVLLIMPIIGLALRGCTNLGTKRAGSISSTIQYQFAVASSATAVSGAHPASARRIAPGACSTRYGRIFPPSTGSRSTQV